jgi:hypothetical protein
MEDAASKSKGTKQDEGPLAQQEQLAALEKRLRGTPIVDPRFSFAGAVDMQSRHAS